MKNQTSALVLALVVASTALTGCGYNTLQLQDEAVAASWSEVLNQYKRRTDLVPNLVEVVKGYAAHESKVLTDVTLARASVANVQATPELVNDPAALQKFIDAQNQMQGALSRLMAITENYPDLKANSNFQNLAVQLEGTENRIAVARQRYIESIAAYNGTVRKFPTNLTAKAFDMQRKPQFEVPKQETVNPQVKF